MRQRLVGALVLLSGGVVLWSVLFTGPAAYKVDRTTQIPPRPEVERVPAVQPREPEGIAPVEAPAERQETPQETPAAPQKEKEPAKKPSPEDKTSTQVARSGAASDASGKSASPSRPGLTPETNLPVAWVVQVASFSKRDNAETLKEELQAKEYKAYVQKFRGAKGDLYRVMVGPKIDQADAKRDQSEIEKAFGMNTLLVQFER